jgi:DNA-binding transcriptional regulator YiaG
MGLEMNRTGKGRNFRTGSRPELNPSFKDMVTTRAMELRRECKTLRTTTEIVNQEFSETLAISTVAKWIDERIKPELEETADAYRQHVLAQIAEAKEALWNRVLRGDDKATTAWTRLLDREVRITGIEKPIQVAVTTNIADKETEFEKMLTRLRRSRGESLPDGHVIQGEVVRREEG